MPIMLDQLQSTTVPPVYKATFFSSKLTGNGKKQGVLSELVNPCNLTKVKFTPRALTTTHVTHDTNSTTKIYRWPLSAIPEAAIDLIKKLPALSANNPFCFKIGTTDNGAELILNMIPHAIELQEFADGAGHYTAAGRKTVICYDVRIQRTGDVNAQFAGIAYNEYDLFDAQSTTICIRELTCRPIAFVQEFMNNNAFHAKFDVSGTDKWLNDYCAVDGVAHRSKIWQTTLADEVSFVLDNLQPSTTTDKGSNVMAVIIDMMQRLEEYNVSLKVYLDIYAKLIATSTPSDAKTISKANLNLMLSDEMTELDRAKPQLERVKPPAGTTVPSDPFFSNEQRAAIETEEPLVLAQAGAGTGKALPVDEPVLTPNGWTPIGNLAVGDKVIGSDGKAHDVTAVHDRGILDGYTLTFTDGATIRCCHEHLWTLISADGQTIQPITTDAMLELLETTNEWSIPYMKAPQSWLGGLACRLGLLKRAMMASDIYKTDNERICLMRAEQPLAHDVRDLLWSLGVPAKVLSKENSETNSSCIVIYHLPEELTFNEDTFSDEIATVQKAHPRKIISWAKLDEACPMRCIEIDSPDHLFVAKDFIVTHNSTTIKGRLNYMKACGVNPADIMVLSFTNAAANHILDIAPDVHSMTIANMVHTIYEKNYPNHQLSSGTTLANTLDIYLPNDSIANGLRDCVLATERKGHTSLTYTQLNNYVENNFDDVIRVLDIIGQTTLTLEIIICYHKIETLAEPNSVKSRHLIIDEVQDNSIFEFVYALRYVAKNKESLFIVGDSSQTLYEFRSSNPRALNVMEASGVFATYKLQINYRSNQDILDFANVALESIEANRFAQIQLQANSLTPVTEQSFKEHVILDYHRINKRAEAVEILQNTFLTNVVPYIEACHKRGEKVAFLAHAQAEVRMLEQLVETHCPSLKRVNIMPVRPYNTDIFSRFIRRYWNEVKFIPRQSIIQAIKSEILNRLQALLGKAYRQDSPAKVSDVLNRWEADWRATIVIWQQRTETGSMGVDEFLANVRQSMLDFEIKNNAMKAAVIANRNQECKNAAEVNQADILFSTIHSVKGLEFDNVFLFHKATSDMSQADQRMYYVALTRAMVSEYIFSSGAYKTPPIVAGYEAIIAQLQQQAQQQATVTP